MIIQNKNLRCNGVAKCPNCEKVYYIQTDIDDTAKIRTCHNCEQSWRCGHGRIFLAYAVQIEAKYICAFRLLELLIAPEAVRQSKHLITAFLREHGFKYDRHEDEWVWGNF